MVSLGVAGPRKMGKRIWCGCYRRPGPARKLRGDQNAENGLLQRDPSGMPEEEAVSRRASRDYRGIMGLWERESLVQ